MKSKLSNSRKILMLLALSLPVSLSWASTMTNDTPNAQEKAEQTETDAKSKSDVEVIGVVGERSLLFFLDQMEEAELDFYDAFNVLADNKKFAVQCRRQKRSGSNIKIKVCNPQFIIDRMAEETQDALSTGAPIPSYKEIEFAVKKEREESLAYVEKIVAENPQLLEKLIVLNEKQAKYEEARQNGK